MTRDTVRSSWTWNTWDPVHPAELIHLPSGAHVAVTAYSDARTLPWTISRFAPKTAKC